MKANWIKVSGNKCSIVKENNTREKLEQLQITSEYQ
jgi:hypothetical protein